MEVLTATETLEDTAVAHHMMILTERDLLRAVGSMKILERWREDTEPINQCSCGGFLEYSKFPSSFTRGKQFFEATSQLQQGSMPTANLTNNSSSTHLASKETVRRNSMTKRSHGNSPSLSTVQQNWYFHGSL